MKKENYKINFLQVTSKKMNKTFCKEKSSMDLAKVRI